MNPTNTLTMPIKLLLSLALSVLGSIVSTSALADTVVVRSGERLGGRILHKGNDTLTLQTDYAGVINIQWSKIVSIATDSPVVLQIEGAATPVATRLAAGENEQVSLVGENTSADAGQAQSIPLNHVLYINPLPEETSDGISYKGRANVSLAKAGGNTSSERVYGETDFNARAREYRYGLNAKVNRDKEGGTLVGSSWLVGGNYDRFLNPKRFLYGRASVEHDVFKDIDQRDVVGAGYGWQLVDSQQTQLSLRSGIDYVNIRHINSPNEQYPSLGWGVKFSHKLDSYHAELFHEQEGFWDITDTSQLTLRTRSGLRVPLMAGITATSQLNVDWERSPTAGRKPTDSMLLFGLGYEW